MRSTQCLFNRMEQKLMKPWAVSFSLQCRGKELMIVCLSFCDELESIQNPVCNHCTTGLRVITCNQMKESKKNDGFKLRQSHNT